MYASEMQYGLETDAYNYMDMKSFDGTTVGSALVFIMTNMASVSQARSTIDSSLSTDDHVAKSRISVVVIDGVTVGHPCCTTFNCKEPLENN
jgi:osmotically-inducible protein OsmY